MGSPPGSPYEASSFPKALASRAAKPHSVKVMSFYHSLPQRVSQFALFMSDKDLVEESEGHLGVRLTFVCQRAQSLLLATTDTVISLCRYTAPTVVFSTSLALSQQAKRVLDTSSGRWVPPLNPGVAITCAKTFTYSPVSRRSNHLSYVFRLPETLSLPTLLRPSFILPTSPPHPTSTSEPTTACSRKLREIS